MPLDEREEDTDIRCCHIRNATTVKLFRKRVNNRCYKMKFCRKLAAKSQGRPNSTSASEMTGLHSASPSQFTTTNIEHTDYFIFLPGSFCYV